MTNTVNINPDELARLQEQALADHLPQGAGHAVHEAMPGGAVAGVNEDDNAFAAAPQVAAQPPAPAYAPPMVPAPAAPLAPPYAAPTALGQAPMLAPAPGMIPQPPPQAPLMQPPPPPMMQPPPPPQPQPIAPTYPAYAQPGAAPPLPGNLAVQPGNPGVMSGTTPYRAQAEQFHEQPVEQLDAVGKTMYACTIIAQLFEMLRQKKVMPGAYMLARANDLLTSCGYQRIR